MPLTRPSPVLPPLPFELTAPATPYANVGLKHDAGKLDFDLVDDAAEAEMVAVLTFGAVKYDPGNWVLVKDAKKRYYAALRRHLFESRTSTSALDPETTLLSLAHAACDIHFLLALELRANPLLASTRNERLAHALAVAREQRMARLEKQAAEMRELNDVMTRAVTGPLAVPSDRSDATIVSLRWTLLSAPSAKLFRDENAEVAAAGNSILARGKAKQYASLRIAATTALRKARRVRGYLQVTEVLANGKEIAHAPTKIQPRKKTTRQA